MNKKQTQTTLNHFTFIKDPKIMQNNQTKNNKKVQQSNQSDLSHNSSTQKLVENDNLNIKISKMHNVDFYSNLIKSDPQGDLIDNIHKTWWNNYNLLQAHHGFIQWLFPNSFTSRFNSKSYALSSQEQKIFRTNTQIAKRYVTSYQMMLQFYGMKLKNKVSGQITQHRTVNFKERYHATLLTSFHNHMRITRILCSLSMIGFGRYAKQLSLFLKQQIHSQKGNLRSLAKYNVDKDWKIYQNFVQTDQDLNIYLKQADKKFCQDKQANLNKYKQQNLKNFGEDVQKSELPQDNQNKTIKQTIQKRDNQNNNEHKYIDNNRYKAQLSPIKSENFKSKSKQKQKK